MTPSLIIPLVLAIFGIALLGGLIFLMLSPVRKLVKFQKTKGRLKQGRTQLARIDMLLRSEKAREAIRLFPGAFLLDIIDDRPTIQAYQEHHQNVLSRCLSVSDALGTRTEYLGDVENLLLERTELLHLLAKARDSFRNLGERRTKEGKPMPAWSKSDFQGRISQIEKELQSNLRNLNEAIEKLCQALRGAETSSITYH